MAGLLIDAKKCVGCGRCAKACANNGIRVEGEKRARRAVPTDDCVYCGSCVDACPVGAIRIERGESAGAADLASYSGIWVFCQTDASGAVVPVVFELLGCARELAASRGCDVSAVLGEGTDAPEGNAAQLIAAGADHVLACRDERLAQNDAECYARLLCDLARERKPEVILYGATNFGRELAPGVAVRLQTGPHRGLHRAPDGRGERASSPDAPRVRRQPDGHHHVPFFPSADGDGASGRLQGPGARFRSRGYG